MIEDRWKLTVVCCVAVVFACGNAASNEPDRANNVSALGVRSAAAGCPAAPPAIGSGCGARALDCSFGDSPLPECRRQFSCVRGQWTNGPRYGTCRQSAACPQAQPAQTSACAGRDAGNRCAFPSGALCTCTAEVCGGSGCTHLPAPQWFCTQVAAGCPRKVPNAGAVCDAGPQNCEYEYCGVTATCRDGIWVWSRSCV